MWKPLWLFTLRVKRLVLPFISIWAAWPPVPLPGIRRRNNSCPLCPRIARMRQSPALTAHSELWETGSRALRPLSRLQIAKTWNAPVWTFHVKLELKSENRPGSYKDRFQPNEKGTQLETELPTVVQCVSEVVRGSCSWSQKPQRWKVSVTVLEQGVFSWNLS